MHWFPLRSDLMEWEINFKALSHIQKIFYWTIIAKFTENSLKKFYKADMEFAIELGVSVSTIRNARRELWECGLIHCEPGTIADGKQLATRYYLAEYAEIPRAPSEVVFFAQMPRFGFDLVLDEMRKKNIKAVDVVTYAYLSYFRWKFKEDGGAHKFYIQKGKFSDKSGVNVNSVGKSVRRLHTLRFAGKPLFDVVPGYREIHFSGWQGFDNPEDEEAIIARLGEIREHLEYQAALEREKQRAQKKREREAAMKKFRDTLDALRPRGGVFAGT